MAFSMSGGSGAGRGRGRGSGTLSEINIVPLVDVVLVLLIIFMLTAHVMEFGMEVEVPKVTTVRDKVDVLPVLTVNRQGETYLNEKPVNLFELGKELKRRFPNADSVYLRADKNTTWEAAIQVVDAASRSGVKVNLVAKPVEANGRP
jgi:biopolymer transport protein ExbD